MHSVMHMHVAVDDYERKLLNRERDVAQFALYPADSLCSQTQVAILLANLRGGMRDHVHLTFRDNDSYDEVRPTVTNCSKTQHVYHKSIDAMDTNADDKQRQGEGDGGVPLTTKMESRARQVIMRSREKVGQGQLSLEGQGARLIRPMSCL